MKISSSKAATLLLFGDFIVYLASLILTLAFRYGQIPGRFLLLIHLPSFSILIIVFLVLNFSAGLYDKQQLFMRGRYTSTVLKSQIINIAFGIAFFYFAPVEIAPKANLFIYFVISTALLILWRSIMFPVVSATRRQQAILVGDGLDIDDLRLEVNGNARYGLYFKEIVPPGNSADETVARIGALVESNEISILVVDLHNRTIEAAMPFLYKMIFSGIQVIDASKLYESIFDRIPISLMGERWLVENASSSLGGRRVYDSLKRLMDVVIASILSIIPLILLPFVYTAVKIDDGGPLFVRQVRIGKDGRFINIAKFRSMTADDSGNYANGRTKHRVTRVGKIIRLTRIDELPQLWSVIKGDQSLIGPRPELPALVAVYEKEIPYYNVRHLIKPGLSGWAQIYHEAHPHHAVAVDDTRDKLSYDLYYIKNRSLGLDIRIALQTVKALLSRQGV